MFEFTAQYFQILGEYGAPAFLWGTSYRNPVTNYSVFLKSLNSEWKQNFGIVDSGYDFSYGYGKYENNTYSWYAVQRKMANENGKTYYWLAF